MVPVRLYDIPGQAPQDQYVIQKKHYLLHISNEATEQQLQKEKEKKTPKHKQKTKEQNNLKVLPKKTLFHYPWAQK